MNYFFPGEINHYTEQSYTYEKEHIEEKEDVFDYIRSASGHHIDSAAMTKNIIIRKKKNEKNPPLSTLLHNTSSWSYWRWECFNFLILFFYFYFYLFFYVIQ